VNGPQRLLDRLALLGDQLYGLRLCPALRVCRTWLF
jgi:hypothetical protein